MVRSAPVMAYAKPVTGVTDCFVIFASFDACLAAVEVAPSERPESASSDCCCRAASRFSPRPGGSDVASRALRRRRGVRDRP